MNTDLKVTIITACLNAKDLIEGTIRSILSQTYPNIEYLIIDGRSTDGTLDILKEYQDKIRIISEPDRGIYDAMNKGIRLSHGQLIYFPNAGDEFVNPHVIAQAVKYSQKYPDCKIIYGNIQPINPSGMWISNEKTCMGKVKNARYLFSNMFSQQRAFFDRSVFEQIGYFDESYKIMADFDLIFKAYQHKIPFGYMNNLILNTPLGGFSSVHIDKFLKERLRSLKYLRWWQWYWAIDLFIGALNRGSFKKYFKVKTKP